jgi:cell division protein FtsQ
MKTIIRILSLLIILLVLIGLLLVYTPLFSINNITVIGNSYYPEKDIIAASGLKNGERVFKLLRPHFAGHLTLRLDSIEYAVKKLSYIENVEVSLQGIHNIQISVTERKAKACLSYLGSWLLIDEEGQVLEVRKERPDRNFKEIKGIKFSHYAISKILETDDAELLQIALGIVKAIERSDMSSKMKLLPETLWVDIINPEKAIISLNRDIIIRLDPSNGMQYRIDFAKEVYFNHLRPEDHGILEFSTSGDPSFIAD